MFKGKISHPSLIYVIPSVLLTPMLRFPRLSRLGAKSIVSLITLAFDLWFLAASV
jgi:hypothetical protein